MKTITLPPELLQKMNAYWRAANHLSVGQINLYGNPLLLSPIIGGAAMSLSSLSVIRNALRLRRVKL